MGFIDKVFKNILTTWFALVVDVVISFFLAPFVVHSLGDVYYGLWAIVMQFSGYLYLTDFGVRESIIRFVSKYDAQGNKSELNDILSSGLILYTFLALLCILVASIVAFNLPSIINVENDEQARVLTIVALITGVTIAQTFIFNVFRGIIMGLQRYDIFNKVGVVITLIRAGLIVLFLTMGYGIIAMASIQFFISLTMGSIVCIFALHLLKARGSKFTFSWLKYDRLKSLIKQHANYSFFVLINNISQKVIFSTDAIVIGIFMTPNYVTFYAIAGNLIEYLRRIIIATTDVLKPLASALDSNDDERNLKLVLINGSKLSLIIGLPIVIVYFFMGRQFIGIWMGTKYAQLAGDVLIILAITQMMSIPHHTINSILYGISKHNLLAYIRMAEAATNIVLSVILVQYYGVIGVAYGTAIPHILVVTFILPILISKIIELNLSEYYLKSYLMPILVSIPFAFAIYFINDYYPSEGLFGFFLVLLLIMPIYLVPVWLFAINGVERDNIGRLFKNMFPGKS